jgi:cyclohexanecarboxylate-CoA ligase
MAIRDAGLTEAHPDVDPRAPLGVDGNTTWWSLVERRAAATPDKTLLSDDEGRSLTCAQFAHEAEELAAGFAALGIGPGSRVSWQLPTIFEAFLTMTALTRLGAHQNPLILGYREREVSFALSRTRAEYVITVGTWKSVDHAALIEAAAELGGVHPELVVVNRETRPRADPATLPPRPSQASEPRWTFYTTGTTSEPKGVLHSDASLVCAADGYIRRLGVGPDDRTAIAFSVAHIGGPDNLGAMLIIGFPCLLLTKFDVESLELMKGYGVSLFGGPAFAPLLLAEQRRQAPESILPNLRIFVGGGGPTPAKMRTAIREEFGATYLPAYGMTEVPMTTVAGSEDPFDDLQLADGRPIDGVELRLASTTSGLEVGVGEEGEVQVRGPALMSGYVDSSMNESAFVDGWFRTGDLGRLTPGGAVRIVGRLKDVVIRKGENISAREIEELLEVHPAVDRVAVVGLPDEDRGELVCAVVTLRPEFTAPGLADVAAFLSAAGLAKYKLPERLEVLDALPVQGAFLKVSKPALRAMFA